MDFQSHNSLAVLTFPAEEGYPRLTRNVLRELGELLATIRRESPFRGVVIASSSESFAIGADLEEIITLDGVTGRDFALAGQALFNSIEHFPLPVVAAIRGFCLGGGLDLALASRGVGAQGKDGKPFRLSANNQLFSQKDYSLQPDFLDTLAAEYGAGVRLLDLQSAPEPSRQSINSWVENNTEGLIPEKERFREDIGHFERITNAVLVNWLLRDGT